VKLFKTVDRKYSPSDVSIVLFTDKNAVFCDYAEKMHRMTMAATFWLSMGYNFGCMIASDTPFDTRGGFSGPSYPTKT